jgi:MoxR-like ATPase
MTTTEKIATAAQQAFVNCEAQFNKVILGQEKMVRTLLLSLLADGHLLVEGLPGLAKTMVIKMMAEAIEGSFHRIQFTPDLLPADITGTDVFTPQDGKFSFQKGPIFHSFILADEINRAPAKVQSALLEAMAERQVTVGRSSYALPKLFLVMATQNPIEHSGTYTLPEAQLDRFLFAVHLGYPGKAVERDILHQARERQKTGNPAWFRKPLLNQDMVMSARQQLLAIHMSEDVETYLVHLILATRSAKEYDQTLAEQIRYGASPRATIGLDRAARAHAWLEGRDYVSPQDIHAVIYEVLRHRLLLKPQARAQGIQPDQVIARLLTMVPTP